ncbi:uncharacterized protein [Halyomorpha halys]|uniref:uncharacterized protein isoform X2 n=1 Tax=Halyomorpha halys TaxID=286706 RepID=UPI0034D21CF1|nr:Gustatory receptor 159f [Halyomorpha halys]
MAKGVHNALSVVLALSKAFGAFTMSFQGQIYVFSYKLYAYFIVLVIGVLVQGIIDAFIASSEHPLSLVMFIDYFVFSIYIFTAIIISFQHYYLRESLPAIISELGDMDQLIGNVSYSGYYKFGVIVLFVLNALPRIFAVAERPFTWNHLLKRTLYFFITVVPVLVGGQYGSVLQILSRQLHSLSEQLNNFQSNLEVWTLIDVHHNLVLLADRINKAFNMYLLNTITFCFVIDILKLYFVIVYIVKPVTYTDLELTVISSMDILVNWGSIFTIVFAAMEAKKKAELFNKQLLKSLLISKTIAQDEKIRTYLGMKHSIQQSACNFFSLDYHLLTSMAAGTTTYVILLVQFTLL